MRKRLSHVRMHLSAESLTLHCKQCSFRSQLSSLGVLSIQSELFDLSNLDIPTRPSSSEKSSIFLYRNIDIIKRNQWRVLYETPNIHLQAFSILLHENIHTFAHTFTLHSASAFLINVRCFDFFPLGFSLPDEIIPPPQKYDCRQKNK